MYVENEIIESSNHSIYFQIDNARKRNNSDKKSVSDFGIEFFKSPETSKNICFDTSSLDQDGPIFVFLNERDRNVTRMSTVGRSVEV